MNRPSLSVVVASVNGMPYLARALDALASHAPEAEVVVADWTNEVTRQRVREDWPAVRLLSFKCPMAVPELRAAGISAASGSYVALIEDHCVVTRGWSHAILSTHRAGHRVVGGPIRNGETRRLRDWAAFFCEYSEHMEPIGRGPSSSLPGMNVSYDRGAIEALAGLLAEGRWETWLHPYLQANGFELFAEPEMLLLHVKDFGVREFVSQRYHYARSHAGVRADLLRWRRAIYALGSPLLVPLLYWRIAGNVFRKRRHRVRFLAATPLIIGYLAIWASGEGVGYAFGGGRSLLKVK